MCFHIIFKSTLASLPIFKIILGIFKIVLDHLKSSYTILKFTWTIVFGSDTIAIAEGKLSCPKSLFHITKLVEYRYNSVEIDGSIVYAIFYI